MTLSWSQPICERDWIDQNSVEVDGESLIRVPVTLNEPHVEQCSFCGKPTIFGAYVRRDPTTVPFPATKDD
jgi:hypothetical protein